MRSHEAGDTHVSEQETIDILPAARAEIKKTLQHLDGMRRECDVLRAKEQQAYLAIEDEKFNEGQAGFLDDAYDFFAGLVKDNTKKKADKASLAAARGFASKVAQKEAVMAATRKELEARFGRENVDQMESELHEQAWHKKTMHAQVGLMTLGLAVSERTKTGELTMGTAFAVTKEELARIQKDAALKDERNKYATGWMQAHRGDFRAVISEDMVFVGMIDAWSDSGDPRYLAVMQQILDQRAAEDTGVRRVAAERH